MDKDYEGTMSETNDRQLEEITEIRLLDYFWILWRNKWSVIAIFLLCVMAAFLVTDFTQSVYQSETTVRILDEQGPSSLLSGLPFAGILKGPSLGTYATLMQSRDLVVTPAVDQLINSGELKPLPVHRGRSVRWFTDLFNLKLDTTLTEQGELTDEEWRDYFVKTLIDEKITVEESQDRNVITLKVRNRNPEYAQLLSNKIAEVLILVVETEKADNMRWWEKPLPQSFLTEAKEQLDEAEKGLSEFQKSHPEITINAEGGTQAQLILALKLSENELASRLIGAELRLKAYQEKLAEVEEELISESITKNPSYSKLQDDLNEYKIERKALIGKYGNVKHPEISSFDEKISETEERIMNEDKEITSTTSTYNPLHQLLSEKVNETEATIAGLKEQKATVSAQVDNNVKELGGWSDQQLELFRLKRDVEIFNTQLIALEAKIRESQIIDETRSETLNVLDQARLSEEPIKPRMKINLVLGAMLGGLLGFDFCCCQELSKGYIFAFRRFCS